MASNYTQNLKLCQWAAEDPVKREDFNADNAKIDAALASKCEILLGSYTGDGTAEREIVLGFRPRYVHVWHNENQESSSHTAYSAIATEFGHSSVDGNPAALLTDQGFKVFNGDYSSNYAGYYVYLNRENDTYSYMVLR